MAFLLTSVFPFPYFGFRFSVFHLPETTADRDARLQLMRTRQSERLAAETTADRDARLQQMSARKCERLAAETTSEREARHPPHHSKITPRYTIYTSNHNIPLQPSASNPFNIITSLLISLPLQMNFLLLFYQNTPLYILAFST